MSLDIRSDAAKYYDYAPEPLDDIPFYISHIPSPQAFVLELGCGTGRVTIPISKHCRYVHGIDLSPAMIAICREKLRQLAIPLEKFMDRDLSLSSNSSTPADPFNLSRFIHAQEPVYGIALAELHSGHKRSHWMWFVFPQIAGLGFSPTAQFYAIKNLAEAKAYLDHPLLGKRLLDCAEAVFTIQGRSISQIFGYPDDLKLRSCMTLFAIIAGDPGSIFQRLLEKYFNGERDARTLELLKGMEA